MEFGPQFLSCELGPAHYSTGAELFTRPIDPRILEDASMSARLLVAASLVICLALAAAAPVHGQSDEQIAAARARGVKYLKQKQKGDGSWEFSSHDVGITALCTIALIENAVPLSDPGVQRAYDYVKKNCTKLKNTYDLSLVIVLLSRFGDRRDK